MRFRLAVMLVLVAGTALGQAPARITQAINLHEIVRLPGNTVWRAHAAVDQGAAPPDLRLEHMLLLLRRSPVQQVALRQLLAAQRTAGSPEYHQWLTPQQFGERFGPAPADVATVEQWLQAQGFSVEGLEPGGLVVAFSGTAAGVQRALHTAMHRYEARRADGELADFWANATDPAIPAALTPVVAGVVSLNNFESHAVVQQITGQGSGHVATPLHPAPELTYSDTNGVTQHALAPGDLDAIYNVNSLLTENINGTGESIAIVARSDIDTNDFAVFRTLFEPADASGQLSVVAATATDPGIATNGDQIEATADAEWAGAAAPDAMLKLVVAASSDTTDGVLLAALYSVDHNVAPILNVSYSACEAGLTSSGNAFVNNMWQQAAAEGITVLVSAGDSGGAACDDPTASVATSGAAVNGMASTPYDTAVGGTELNEGTQAGYWGTARGDYSSATGYIPEQPWDESGGDTGGGGLNAGGGGASTIYTNPYWQIADGIPSNNSARLVPDVSLAAAGGHDGYVICINGACAVNSGGSFKFNVVGGTSLATPSFAGMMALVDQKTASGKGLGLINPVLYRLYPASSTALAACASGGPPAASCIFNDITTGSNDVLCTPVNVGHCSASGKLGYNAAAGYDLATGLGSVNAANLVNGWSSITFPVSQTTLSVPASETVGQSTALSITVAPAASGGTAASPTGTVDLMAQGSDGSEALVQSYTLGAGGTTGNVSTVALPGGTYNVVADYEGDANYGPSTSSAASITVAKATPTVTLQLAFSAPQPFYFGDSLQTQVTVSGPAGAATATGTVTSNYSSGSSAVTAFGATTLDPTGLAVVTDPFTAAPGTYQFTAQYAGDNSYNAAGTTTAPMLTVLPSPTGITISQGGAGHIEVALSTQSQNAFPAAAPQIFDGTTAMGTVSLGAPTANANTGFLAATGTFALPANLRAPGTITVQYAGETGFTKSTSNPVTIPGYTLAGGSAATVSAGQTATITITATPFGGFTGTVSLSCSGLPAGATCSSKPATLDGTQAASMALSIQTTGTQAGAVAAWEWPGNRTEDYGLLLLCALGLIAISVAWRRRQFAAWAGMAALSALLLLTAACGGGSGPPPVKRDVTPAGIYTITISGSTTGQPATTITVHLTVI